MKILFIGDIIGEPGRQILRRRLNQLKADVSPHITIANVENAAGGFGLTVNIAEDIFSYGIDVFTSGNHIWDKKQIKEYLNTNTRVLRPANYPEGVPGVGWGIFQIPNTCIKIGIVNLEGRVYMNHLRDPFTLGKSILLQIHRETSLAFIDFHAEVTSEKRALGWYLDGLATALIGTHTHVQTADEEILPKGTAYLTDVGMTGGKNSVIGVKKEDALHRFLYQTPARFTPAPGNLWINAVLIEADESTGKACAIQRIQYPDTQTNTRSIS
jgi:hypothetical protein